MKVKFVDWASILNLFKLDSLIDNNSLFETNSNQSTASLNYTENTRLKKDNSLALSNQTDFEDKPDDSSNSNNSLILTRNRSKTSTNKVKSNSQSTQQKKTICKFNFAF